MSDTAALVGKVVAPGDQILQLPEEGQVRIGSGLRPQDGHIAALKCGVVRQTRGGKLWLEGRQKRYIPAEEDVVVGVIKERHLENFVVDIAGPFTAQLPMLSFEGATRRNRPNLFDGDVVFARVIEAHRDMDPVLSCVDAAGKASGFGHLKGGLLGSVPVSYARALLGKPQPPALVALARSPLQFELAVGLNGRVWVNAPSAAGAAAALRAIQGGELRAASKVEAWVQGLVADAMAASGGD